MALLTVEHFVALDVAHVAHVANVSEGEVVVEASLASPVTNSLLDLLGRGGGGLGRAASILLASFFRVVGFITSLHFLQETLLLSLGSLSWRHGEMLWHTFAVVDSFRLLASVAFLSSFEVVVLALAAFPSTVWELEVVGLSGWLDGLLWNEGLDVVQVEGLVEWLDTTG